MVTITPKFVKHYRSFYVNFQFTYVRAFNALVIDSDVKRKAMQSIKKPTSPYGEAGFRGIGCLKIERSVSQLLKYCLS